MYTRSRQNQNYTTARGTPKPAAGNAGQFQTTTTYQQGSYQPSGQGTPQPNYKTTTVQPQQQNQQTPQPQRVQQPVQKVTPNQQSIGGQQQQQMQQQQMQMQQQPPTTPQTPRLKPILKQSSTPTVTPVAASVQGGTPSTPQNTPQSTPTANTMNTMNTTTTPVSGDAMIQAQNESAAENALLEGMETDEQNTEEQQNKQPRWRRKIPGFKVNKKLKRLRLNQRLRKTLQPKNAIMVLNEMKTEVQFTFPETQAAMPNSLFLVHAEIDGKTYVGQGLSKPLARQNAAENALKSLLLEKMTAAAMKARIDAENDGQAANQAGAAAGATPAADGDANAQGTTEVKTETGEESKPMETNATEEADEIPWSSLASFALYKLFLEWQNQGTVVPVPRPGISPGKPRKEPKVVVQKELPPGATNIHPVMLLNQMRPGLTYVEVNRSGNPPNTMFTLSVEVDGVDYSGTAKNKKDAKKIAAKAALEALYGLTYPEEAPKVTDHTEDIAMT